MAVDTTSHAAKGGVGVARSPQSVLKTVRPKLLRRASLTSWGKDNLGMTRAAAGLNLRELMLTVQQQKVLNVESSLVVLACPMLGVIFSYSY